MNGPPLFVPGKEYHESTQLEYDLLLIKPPGDNRTKEEMADIVKDIPGTSPGITCVVCSTEEVLEDLATGARFMITIYGQGLLLHNASGTPLPEPVATYTATRLKEATARDWQHRITLARRQLILAEHADTRLWSIEAAGLLQQSVEQLCIALIGFYMGYRPKTEKLEGLFALMDNFCSYHRTLFPCCTDEENIIYNVFLVNTPEARFIDILTPHPDTVQIVLKRVKRLHEWADQRYDVQIAELDKIITYAH